MGEVGQVAGGRAGEEAGEDADEGEGAAQGEVVVVDAFDAADQGARADAGPGER